MSVRFCVRNLRQIFAVDQDAAARRAKQSAEQMQQRRFAAARRAHYRDEFALLNLERDAAKCRALPACRSYRTLLDFRFVRIGVH